MDGIIVAIKRPGCQCIAMLTHKNNQMIKDDFLLFYWTNYNRIDQMPFISFSEDLASNQAVGVFELVSHIPLLWQTKTQCAEKWTVRLLEWKQPNSTGEKFHALAVDLLFRKFRAWLPNLPK